MAGYVRNDTANNIAPDKDAQAGDIDGEFDAIQAAFHSTTGHAHDGTTAEGAPILVLGPDQEVEISATAIYGAVNNDIDLGTTTKKFKNAYIAGNIVVDGTVDGVDIATRNSDLASAQSTITAHGTRLTTAESNITAIQGVNSTQNTRLSNLESSDDAQDITDASLQTQINTLVTMHTAQQTAINSLQSQLNASQNTILNKIFPVNSLYITHRNENPATTLGIGTWVAHGEGRALVGVGTADEVSYSVGQTRGANDITLSLSQIPTHAHNSGAISVSVAAHNESFSFDIYKFRGDFAQVLNGSNIAITDVGSATASSNTDDEDNPFSRIAWNINHTHSASASAAPTGNAGSGGAHSNIQPSIGVFVWRRTS